MVLVTLSGPSSEVNTLLLSLADHYKKWEPDLSAVVDSNSDPGQRTATVRFYVPEEGTPK